MALLLAYLLIHRQRVHSRLELATLLFPDWDEACALTYLRTTLYHLKKLLLSKPMKEPYLLITPQTIGFNRESEYWLDIEGFEELLEGASQEPPQTAYEMRLKALELYRGDLLAGHYENWVLHEQERLRTYHQEALAAVADHEEQSGLSTQAITHLQALLVTSPLREEIHRQLIGLFLKQGGSRSGLEAISSL